MFVEDSRDFFSLSTCVAFASVDKQRSLTVRDEMVFNLASQKTQLGRYLIL